MKALTGLLALAISGWLVVIILLTHGEERGLTNTADKHPALNGVEVAQHDIFIQCLYNTNSHYGVQFCDHVAYGDDPSAVTKNFKDPLVPEPTPTWTYY